MSKPVVFIHTNEQQMLGAIASAHSFRRQSRHPERFEIRILRLEETPHLHRREGQRYLRMGKMATWHNDDLQSFSPLRRWCRKLMGYQGRALVTDPDVFSVGGDVLELLESDMGGKAVICRNLPAEKGGGAGKWASSVMLLDCARLTALALGRADRRHVRRPAGLQALDPAGRRARRTRSAICPRSGTPSTSSRPTPGCCT